MKPAVSISVLVVALGFAVAAGDAALTNEDVVRAWVGGTSVQELIQRIEAAEVAFDVSPEMLDELNAAGLPAELIEAMRRRQAEIDAANAPPPEPEPERPPQGVAVRFNVDLDEEEGATEPPAEEEETPTSGEAVSGGPVLRFLDLVHPGLARSLSLPDTARHFTDAAFVLLCTDTRHVPDQWRSKTPLGRDFVNTPRHRLLAWVGGARQVEQGRLGKLLGDLAGAKQLDEAQVLELPIPERLQANTAEGDVHDLTLGLALEADGRFYLIRADRREGVATGTILTATVKGRRTGLAQDLTLRFDDE